MLLKDYLVVDASRILVGSISSLMLAELGASVVKIEIPGHGDDTRHWGPPFLDHKTGKDSTYYMSLNRNKKSVTIDMKTELGLKAIRDLTSKADIFIQNFPPRTAEKLKVDYKSLKDLNSSLIYA